MARKIKETPVLYGKDAENFAKAIKENETRKVPAWEYNRAIRASKLIAFAGINTQ